MSLVSITGQQRYDIAYRVQLAEILTQDFIETLGTLKTDKAVAITTALTNLTTALAAAGLALAPLTATQVIVSSAGTATATVTTATSRTAGQSDSKTVTFTVAGGVITAIAIP